MATDIRFIVDLNVGRLAKWLTVMGYDNKMLAPDPLKGSNDVSHRRITHFFKVQVFQFVHGFHNVYYTDIVTTTGSVSTVQ